jgi:hypothetical protein
VGRLLKSRKFGGGFVDGSGSAYHDHAWTAPTTGFILVVCGVSKAGLKARCEMRRRRDGMACGGRLKRLTFHGAA